MGSDRNPTYVLWTAVYGAAALWAAFIMIEGVPLGAWQVLVLMALLLIYFQLRSISFGEHFQYSLAMVIVFPAIFVYGPGAGALFAAFGAFVDAVSLRKSWDKTLFNIAQLVLSALAAAWMFDWAGGAAGTLSIPHGLLPMAAGALGYSAVNLGSVTFVVSRHMRTSWWSVIRNISWNGLLNYLVVGYVGSITAAFVAQWGGWGLLVFGTLLVGLTELLQIGLKVNSEQNLRRQAEEAMTLDAKTSAHNFRHLNQWLSQPYGEQEAVLFIDIDDFKTFNDRYGHHRGDEALRSLVKGIRKTIRDDADTVVRFGGEEFVVILPGSAAEEGKAVAERIRSQLRLLPEAGFEEPLTVSIGLASIPQDCDNRHDLLKYADLAMYQAKAQGKDRICQWCQEWGESESLLLRPRHAR